jgi:hypothetical protein
MRAAAMFLFSLFLSGCLSGNSVLDEAVAFRQTLLNSNGCQFAAELTADYGDFVYTFSVECEAGQNGDMTFCVTSPETIAGITGKLSGTGGKLTFDDHLLQFDMLAEGLNQYIYVYCPDVIILGGGITRGLQHYHEELNRRITAQVHSRQHTEIRFSELMEASGVLGAAMLFGKQTV